jgi:hypothetical protein
MTMTAAEAPCSITTAMTATQHGMMTVTMTPQRGVMAVTMTTCSAMTATTTTTLHGMTTARMTPQVVEHSTFMRVVMFARVCVASSCSF